MTILSRIHGLVFGGGRSETWFFAATVFVSAFLVFLVEPLAGKLMLPLMGGAPAVWNTSLAFFQIALLAGYAYAHGLQMGVKSLTWQWTIHLGVLALAALALPLGLTSRFGTPDPMHPVVWILAVLTLSIGPTFFALSATAPLVQTWFARTATPAPDGKPLRIYALYAASNLGSLLSLIAYPALIEPLSAVSWQCAAWSIGFIGFAMMIAVLGLKIRLAGPAHTPSGISPPDTPSPGLTRILIWIGLAAAPSSLLTGVTTHLAEDVASAPFLWVAPLALYLVSFVLAFSARRWVPTPMLLTLQAATLLGCIAVLPATGAFWLQLELHLLGFFLTAWMCHQILASQQPDPRYLTQFYLCLSFGGVVGGAFNAFVVPVIFDRVIEYPLVLVLAVLARPWGGWRLSRAQAALFIGAAALFGALYAVQHGMVQTRLPVAPVLLIAAMIATFLLRDRALYFAALVAGFMAIFLAIPTDAAMSGHLLGIKRSFFGVVKTAEIETRDLGRVRLMMHGTTTHGAQAVADDKRCLPLTYYGVKTGIGRTMLTEAAVHPALNIGVVGLGVGTLATYLRPTDHLTYYEIDPLVAQYASDPAMFTYLSHCARGTTAITLGDGRQSLKADRTSRYDLLVIDAFSSDSVPAHLLTTEAMQLYFDHLAPDGVVLFHISNRHLALAGPVTATVRAAGGTSLRNLYLTTGGGSFQNLSTEVIIAAKSPAALQPFATQPGFKPFNAATTRPWTDDYTNVVGALLAHR